MNCPLTFQTDITGTRCYWPAELAPPEVAEIRGVYLNHFDGGIYASITLADPGGPPLLYDVPINTDANEAWLRRRGWGAALDALRPKVPKVLEEAAELIAYYRAEEERLDEAAREQWFTWYAEDAEAAMREAGQNLLNVARPLITVGTVVGLLFVGVVSYQLTAAMVRR